MYYDTTYVSEVDLHEACSNSFLFQSAMKPAQFPNQDINCVASIGRLQKGESQHGVYVTTHTGERDSCLERCLYTMGIPPQTERVMNYAFSEISFALDPEDCSLRVREENSTE